MSESQIQALIGDDELELAVERTLELYGDRCFRYLVTLSGDPQAAADAYQEFCIDLWKGLKTFAWRSALSTWCFTLARNAFYRSVRGKKRSVRLGTEEANALPDRWTRTATAAWRRTEARTALQQAIDALPEPDRELLALRLTERLGWREIAEILHTGDPAPRKRAAALRKQYQRLKDRLRDHVGERSDPGQA